jgi:phenylacetate-coenzyme A ligase PaaK-like adenylate-forming protein
VPNLPILAINGRVDGTITLYALNIYPEQIETVMESPKIREHLTGRAIIEKLENEKAEPYLKLTVELKPNTEENNLESKIQDLIVEELAKINTEYHHLLDKYGPRVKPIIDLRPFGSCEGNFKSGKSLSIKQ